MTPVETRMFVLDRPSAEIAALHALLDDDERAQATRFRFARDRSRFIARRGWLRTVLGEHLSRAPAEIAFERNEFGKPFVRRGGALRFNLSHSGGLALCVIGRGVEVGCDLERRDPALASLETAERLFAPGERHALRSLPPRDWARGFFNCWTRKEAYIKALGEGLSHPLDAFEVSLHPDLPARLLHGAPGWLLRAFAPVPGYHAAIAVRNARQGWTFAAA